MVASFLAFCVLPYLAAVSFYHSHGQRSAARLSGAQMRALRVAAWLLLLGAAVVTTETFGLVRGVFYSLFAVGLIMLLSQWFATRWPQWHWWSGAGVSPLLLLMMVR